MKHDASIRERLDAATAPAGPATALALRLAGLAAVALAAATLVLSWLRLFYGVDFTDESFYVALPYRFALGDLPLRDEQNMAQFAGYLALPFIRLFLWVTGEAEGLVLFARHLHLAFTAAVGIVVFLALRRALLWPDALAAATICLVFVPFNIHGLSYNTLGSGFLTIGAFLLLREPRAGTRYWANVAAGVAHGLMALVYPTLAPVAVVFIVLLATQAGGDRRAVAFYIGGLLAAALVPLWLLAQAGWASIPGIRTYLAAFHSQLGGMDKVVAVIHGFSANTPYLACVLAALGTLWVWNRWHPPFLRYLLPLLPAVLGLYWIQPNGTASLFLIAVLAIAGPFVYRLVADDAFARTLMRLVWAPSFLAGLITSWSSSNGAQNACIGMFPAALASVVFIQLASGRRRPVSGWQGSAAAGLRLGVAVLVIVPLLWGGYADYYGEPVQRARLTHRVEGGPFHRLMTTAPKHAFLERFAREAKPHMRPGDRVLVFNEWPAGYLLAGVRAGANSVWLPSAPPGVPVDRRATFEYWARTGHEPDVILLVKDSEVKPDALLEYAHGPAFAMVADLKSVTLRRRVAGR